MRKKLPQSHVAHVFNELKAHTVLLGQGGDTGGDLGKAPELGKMVSRDRRKQCGPSQFCDNKTKHLLKMWGGGQTTWQENNESAKS